MIRQRVALRQRVAPLQGVLAVCKTTLQGQPWTVLRTADAALSVGCAFMVIFSPCRVQTHGIWQLAWLASAVFCAASAWWSWADRLNVLLKKWLIRTALGAALRLR